MTDAQSTYALPPAIGELDPVDKSKLQQLGNALAWLPTGKVLREFVFAPEPTTVIMGPYGSGKTTGGFIKGLMCSCVVPRSPIDGVRYARGIVVRDTYRNLEMNTIPSWHERFPPGLGSFKGGGGGEPAKAIIDFEISPGEILHLEVIFAAIGDHNVKQFCDGFQATWCFANGIDSLPPDFIPFMRPRLGRWPPPQHRPPDWKDHVYRWRKLFGDCNAPDIDNHIYGDAENNKKGFVENVPAGWRLFTQPGGMDPDAENLANLEKGYYENLIGDNEEWWVNRFVHNKWGFSRAGTPVYPKWNDKVHVAREDIKFDRTRKLILGIDAGRTACAIALQRSITGRVDVLDEFIPKVKMAAKEFGHALSQWCADNFPDADIKAYADPAAANPSDTADDDQTWIDICSAAAEIKIKPAPTNAITARLEAVNDALTLFDGEKPGFQLSPRCKRLRRGFNSEYRFGHVKKHGDQVETEVPVKNKASHPHDALQYGALGSSDYRELRGRQSNRGQTVEEVSWDPHG